MFAVIFRAEIVGVDKTCSEMAAKMRNLALDKYGCSEFISVTEGGKEISISYWETQEQIQAWKQDTDHKLAQEFGRSKWYKSYKVQVVEIICEYKKTHNTYEPSACQ